MILKSKCRFSRVYIDRFIFLILENTQKIIFLLNEVNIILLSTQCVWMCV